VVIRFVAAVADVGAERFDSATSAATPAYVGWSMCSSNGKVYHDDGHGAVTLDFGTGSATAADIAGADKFRKHGILMSAGYGLMVLGTVVALGKGAFPGGWFLAHRWGSTQVELICPIA
jgi:hypothetical protein